MIEAKKIERKKLRGGSFRNEDIQTDIREWKSN